MGRRVLFLGGGACEGLPISEGSTGAKVSEVQALLGIPATGIFDANTAVASMAAVGTQSVNCRQYKQLSGRGITPEKVQTGIGIIGSIIDIFGKPAGGGIYVPRNPPEAEPASKNNTAIIVILSLVAVGAILFAAIATRK